MVVSTKTKPIYSLKPKKLLKLNLDRDIGVAMTGNLIWICESQKATCILLVGKMQGWKNVYFIMLAPYSKKLTSKATYILKGLLLQFEIWKSMHISVNIYYI
jgi:hypothetical protein